MRLEGSLEFSDDDDEATAVPPDEVRLTLDEARGGIDQLLELAPAGRLLREGVHIALLGPTNAGKSSLFNRLVGADRALVDAEPGTTRDIVTATVRRGGRLYVLHDTAGLRDEAGRVETMGMARAREAAAQADLVLELAEAPNAAATCAGASAPGASADGASADGASRAGAFPVHAPSADSLPATLRVLTKCDLLPPGGGVPAGGGGHDVSTSALTGAGLDALWAAIEQRVAAWRLDEAVSLGVVLNERHRQRLLECREELAQLATLYADGAAPGDEVAGTLLASLLARLGEISGRVFTEQMLDGVFRRFCVGK